MNWQPIETAPRDGTAIWLTWMENGEPMESYVMSWGSHLQKWDVSGKVRNVAITYWGFYVE